LQNKTLNEYLEQLKIYVEGQNYNKSIDLLNEAISQYPKENKLKLNVGNIYKLLDEKDNAFFSVNAVARKEDKNTANTNPYITKFLRKSKWRPKKIEVFAGRIDYPKYNAFDKYMIRFIMWITSGPTNMNESYEFTNWNQVKKFAQEIS